MSFESPESVAIELQQFVENDGKIYQQMTQPILKNLATKKVRGVYKKELAHKAFMNLAEAGAKLYVKEVAGGEGSWHVMFPIDVRRIVASNWVESFETEYGYGNYNDFLPKKYQNLKESKTTKKRFRAMARKKEDASGDYDWTNYGDFPTYAKAKAALAGAIALGREWRIVDYLE